MEATGKKVGMMFEPRQDSEIELTYTVKVRTLSDPLKARSDLGYELAKVLMLKLGNVEVSDDSQIYAWSPLDHFGD